ncbi:hypothetical protein B0J12DRAFT_434916 [Macrophomina phaseolina]|uniref:Uncharacterized protein n=1 Tax=Macrophomina phaseolina TaxID=35725 RepID=A0ABQ8GKD8_9PEZI|nr:hypothetical protein B0J12DRAFT_434916 [Macrophomina phaseolina]
MCQAHTNQHEPAPAWPTAPSICPIGQASPSAARGPVALRGGDGEGVAVSPNRPPAQPGAALHCRPRLSLPLPPPLLAGGAPGVLGHRWRYKSGCDSQQPLVINTTPPLPPTARLAPLGHDAQFSPSALPAASRSSGGGLPCLARCFPAISACLSCLVLPPSSLLRPAASATTRSPPYAFHSTPRQIARAAPLRSGHGAFSAVGSRRQVQEVGSFAASRSKHSKLHPPLLLAPVP